MARNTALLLLCIAMLSAGLIAQTLRLRSFQTARTCELTRPGKVPGPPRGIAGSGQRFSPANAVGPPLEPATFALLLGQALAETPAPAVPAAGAGAGPDRHRNASAGNGRTKTPAKERPDSGVRQRGKRDTASEKRDEPGEADTSATPEAAKRSRRLVKSATEAIKRGDFEQAMDLLYKGIAEDPGNGQAYRTLAGLYRDLGMTAEEMAVYEQWMGAVPHAAGPHYMLAQLYLQQGFNTDAVSELAEFRALSGDSVQAYPMMAGLYRQLGMQAEEAWALAAWATQAPDSADAHRALGDFLRRTGDYQGAITEYARVSELAPGNTGAHTSLASVYTRLGMHDYAQQEYLTAIESRPGDMGLYLRLAESYRRAGDLNQALSTYGYVLSTQPGSPQASQAERLMTRIQRQIAQPKRTGAA